MSKEQMAEQIVNLAFDEDYGDGSLTFFDMCKSVAIRALELAEQSAEKRLKEATQHQEKRIAELEAKLAEKDALLQGRIAVPKVELEKLEEARVALYKFLEDKLSEQQLLSLPNITGQIWRVANRKTWEDVK